MGGPPEELRALASAVQEAHADAVSKMRPLNGPQCPKLIDDGVDVWACQVEEGHTGDCVPPDPILGVT